LDNRYYLPLLSTRIHVLFFLVVRSRHSQRNIRDLH
jgi:hypothetical protein